MSGIANIINNDNLKRTAKYEMLEIYKVIGTGLFGVDRRNGVRLLSRTVKS